MCIHHVLDLQDEGMMEFLTPEVERTRTCPCPIEAGPFALEMTQIPEPCDNLKITPTRSCAELDKQFLRPEEPTMVGNWIVVTDRTQTTR